MNSTFGQHKRKRPARYPVRNRLARANRRLASECLECRVLLAGDTLAWHNADLPWDTNGDLRISSHDALLVVNYLNVNGPSDVDLALDPGLIDVTGDGVVSAMDALEVFSLLNSGAGESHEKVQVRLVPTAVDNLDPLTTIGPEETFVLRAFVTDLTDPAEGVFGAYIDVTYQANLADTTGDVQHADDFGNGPNGDLSVDGLLNEVGSFAGSFSGTGDEETLLFSVPMTTLAGLGTLSFTGDPADVLPNFETTLFGENDAVLPDEILFVGASLQVSSGDPPAATDDAYSGLEDSVLQVDATNGVLANDLPIGANLTAELVRDANSGTVALNSDGSFSYSPDEHFNGQDSFTYTASDGVNASEEATVTLSISAVNDPPIAAPDAYSVPANETLTVVDADGVLANDNDIEGSGLTVVVDQVTGPENGTVTLMPGGGFTYVPDADFQGIDTFTYVVSDGEDVAEGIVTITVGEPIANAAPMANDDTYTATEDTVLTVLAPGVLENDVDPDDDALTVSLDTPPTHGELVLNTNGSFQYTPNFDFAGTDTFIYMVSDGTDTDTATVTINVNAVNDPPSAQDETYLVEFETPLHVPAAEGVLANDTDPDSPVLTARLVREPSNGEVTLDEDGSFTYTPNEGFHGIDSFQYAVEDEELSRLATTTLDVRPAETEQPLVAFRIAATDADGAELTTIQMGDGFQLRVFVDDLSEQPQQGVFAAYLDIEWDPSLAVVAGPIEYTEIYPNGTIGDTTTPGLIDEAGAFDGLTELGGDEQLLFSVPMQATGAGVVTFSSNPADNLPVGNVLLFITQDDAVPTDRITYGGATLTVEGLSEPLAVNDSYDVQDGMLTVPAESGLLANDAAPEGGSLLAVLEQPPQNGTLELNEDGSFTYTADLGFVGSDSFTYRAASGETLSEPATVTLNVGNPVPGSISGSVYFDTNNDGVRESHEHPFGGVQLTLTGTDLFGNDVERSAVTGSDGLYSFMEVMPGNYAVAQAQPAIVIDGVDSVAGDTSILDDVLSVQLSSDANLTDLNFGERGLMPEFFGNAYFFATADRGGASIGLSPDGVQSWYCIDSGWDGFRSIQAALSADRSTVTITAIQFNGQALAASVSASSPNVRLIGNATKGYLIRLGGVSNDYGLEPVANTAAVDAVFAT